MSIGTTRRWHLLGTMVTVALLIGVGCYVWVERPHRILEGTTDQILSASPRPEPGAAVTRKSSHPSGIARGDVTSPTSPASADFSKDRLEEPDFAVEAQPANNPDFPDTPLGRRLASHLLFVEGTGPDAQTRYQASLDKLREMPEEATELLLNAYEGMAEERYLDRWKVVDTISTLQSHASLEALAQIASEAVPEELFPDAHNFSSRTEEELIRIAAIEGLEYLASRGVLEAAVELRELISTNDPVVQENAVRAYRHSGGDPREIKDALPEEKHWMLELQELADVRSMPPVNPADQFHGEQGAGKTQINPHTNDTDETVKKYSVPPKGAEDDGMSILPQTNMTSQ